MDLHLRSSNEPEEDKSIGSSSIMSDKEGWPLRRYCTICHENTDHYTDICPDRSKFVGIFCPVCHGPCKNNDDEEHRKTRGEIVIYCDVCFRYAGHWGKDCPEVPLPGYAENRPDYDIGF